MWPAHNSGHTTGDKTQDKLFLRLGYVTPIILEPAHPEISTVNIQRGVLYKTLIALKTTKQANMFLSLCSLALTEAYGR